MSVGQTLSAARADRGLTVEELSQSTRIRGTLIRAIENDDFSLCGGDVYARGHIRSITRVLGLDPEPVLAEFDADHPREDAGVTVEAIGEEWKPVARDRRGPAWGLAMLVAVLLGLSAVAAVSLATNGDGNNVADPSPSISVTSPPPTEAPTGDPTPSEAPPTEDPGVEPTDPIDPDIIARGDGVHLTLRLVGDDQCWVSVTDSSGGPPEAFTLRPGDPEREFTDDEELRLVIGNAGALQIVHNGVDLGVAGDPGEVVHRTFTAPEPTSAAG